MPNYQTLPDIVDIKLWPWGIGDQVILNWFSRSVWISW